jgi:uncharacterized protein YbjQ (UPF0145 family)
MSGRATPLDGGASLEADLRQLGRALGEGEHGNAAGAVGVTSDLSLDEIMLLHSLGLEPAQVVFGVGCTAVTAGVWTWSVGKVSDADTAFSKALDQAKEAVHNAAAAVRAVGVLGVEVEVEYRPRRFLVTITGTAVRPAPDQEGHHFLQKAYRHPFVCDLSARDFVVLAASGWYPMDLVAGVSFVHAPRRTMGATFGQATQNVELTNFTETLYQAREAAMAGLQRDIHLAGGTGLVDAKLVDRPVPFATHVVEFLAYGTAIKRLAPEHTHPNIAMVVPLDDEQRAVEATSLT